MRSERRHGQPLRVCIVARTGLGKTTRVVRQAQALLAAGHQVTVVCRQRPVQELLDTVPSVEWIEIETEPWTRRFVERTHRRMKAREERSWWWTRRAKGPHARAVRLGLAILDRIRSALRFVFLELPGAVLLRAPDVSARTSLADLRALNATQLAHTMLRPLSEDADSGSFADKAKVALAGRAFDICQAHDTQALLPARALARSSGAKLIFDATHLSEHRSWMSSRSLLERVLDRRRRRAEGAILRRKTAAVITVSEGFADWYAKRYRITRPAVVRNCRHYRANQPTDEIRRDCGIGEGARLVVWAGYPYPQQGIASLIGAAAASRPDVHFALVGDPRPAFEAFHQSLQVAARERGVASRVHFLKGREPLELISYLSGADVGIIPVPGTNPHLRHSLPNKIFEMVMARIPVAVSDLPDLRALVEQYGIGRAFDVEDSASIAAAIDALLVPGERARLRDALERAASELSWEKEGALYLEAVEAAADR